MFDKHQLIKELKKGTKTFPKLARRMNIPQSKNREFSKFILNLSRQGEIFQTPNREYFVPEIEETLTGIIRLNARGFGFVDIPEQEEKSIFIPPTNVNSAMDRDEVLVDIFKDPSKDGYFQGIIKEIKTRSRKYFVGRIVKNFNGGLTIKPLNEKIKGKFKFEDQSDLKLDYEVKVEIISYGNPFVVKVINELGHMSDMSIDILSEIEDANIPLVFGPNTIREANSLPDKVNEDDLKNRVDLRDRMIVTVDGDDTKDFDDAIEVQKLENGNYYLGVHIADVTHYVTEGTALDDEAQNRGTSVYLADRVIPMLPVALSNGICSLNPNVDRLTLSCECEIDKNGNTVSHKIFASVINSKKRLTYKDVNQFYRNLKSFDDNKDLEVMLNHALDLSKIIRKYKEKEGYIDFEIEESKIIIGDDGKTSDIIPRERLESEMLIEDFMVRANETVAHHVENNELPFIYRIHDKPDLERVANLQNVIKALDIDVEIPQVPIPREFARSINEIKKTRFDDFMKVMMLRTMAKAIYSPNNIGHFGLASESYSHFTSPIRRYPDLIAHRMLREYFFKGNKKSSEHFATVLPSISEHSSMTEQRAMDLERRVADIKKAEFYEQFIGQSFKGTVISMMKFGFFVEFPNKVGGLVHSSTLVDGDYKLSDNGYSFTNGSRKISIGDKINVTVVNALKTEGKIDLVMTDLYEEWKSKDAKMMKNNNRRK